MPELMNMVFEVIVDLPVIGSCFSTTLVEYTLPPIIQGNYDE